MKQEGLMYFTDTWMTLIGLIIFFSYFVIMLIRVYRIKREYVDTMSQMPLQETENE